MSQRRKTRPRRIIEKINPAKIGAPPGTPIHVGPRPEFQPYINATRYSENEHQEWPRLATAAVLELISKQPLADSEPNVLWIDVEGVHDTGLVSAVGQALDLHPLTVEDVVNCGLRPTFEPFAGYYFFALNMIYLVPEDPENPTSGKVIVAEHASFVLKNRILCTFQEKPGDIFGRIRERLTVKTSKLRLRGADHLLYTVLDAIVDGYLQVIDHLADRIERLEDDLRQGPRAEHLQQIYALKRDILWLRKMIFPVRDMMSKVQVEQSVFQDRTKIYLRDLSEHTAQVIDSLSISMEMVAVLLDTWHSLNNQRMNAIMKTLTMISTVFLPLNFIAGVYGMNFHHMPELLNPLGYPLVLVAMGLVAALIISFFVQRGWLWERSRSVKKPTA